LHLVNLSVRTGPSTRAEALLGGQIPRDVPPKSESDRGFPPGGRCEVRALLGQNRGMREERALDTSAGRGLQIGGWESSVIGLFVSLVIVGPTFLLEETWHGAPLIDRGGVLWVAPAVVMAFGFFVGGAIAGYQRARVQGALSSALLVSFLTIVLAFLGDLARRRALGEGLQHAVAEYWVGAVFAAVFVGALGGVGGRWLGMKMGSARSLDVTSSDAPDGDVVAL
jgi:hypothetical protein